MVLVERSFSKPLVAVASLPPTPSSACLQGAPFRGGQVAGESPLKPILRSLPHPTLTAITPRLQGVLFSLPPFPCVLLCLYLDSKTS